MAPGKYHNSTVTTFGSGSSSSATTDPFIEFDIARDRLEQQHAVLKNDVDRIKEAFDKNQMENAMQQQAPSKVVYDPNTGSYRVERELVMTRAEFDAYTNPACEAPQTSPPPRDFAEEARIAAREVVEELTKKKVIYDQSDDLRWNRKCVNCGLLRHDGESCRVEVKEETYPEKLEVKKKIKYCLSCGQEAHGANLGRNRSGLCSRVTRATQTVKGKKFRKVFWHRHMKNKGNPMI